MNILFKFLFWVSSIIITASITACGGGGGGGKESESFTVTATASQGGTISPTSITVASGSTETFTLTPEQNFSIESVTGCSGTLNGNSYTTGAISSNCVVSASFTPSTQSTLPSTGVNEYSPDVALGSTEETLLSESENPEISEPKMVEYDYDIRDPDKESNATQVEVRMACTTKRYDIKSNPRQIAVHGLDSAITWPGALLQGDSYRNGTFRSIAIDPDDRAPLKVVIKNVYNNSGKSSNREVEAPSFASVTDAVNELIVDGYNDDLPIGGSVVYSETRTKSATRGILKTKLSSQYGTLKGELESQISQEKETNTLLINLTQKLFEVVVEEPPTKEDWFNDSFYQETLPEKMSRGEISETNPPVYISKVIYGRILSYAMNSTASISDMNALLKASNKTLKNGTSVEISGNLKKVQDSIAANAIALGGNNTLAIEAANSGEWGKYFAEDLSLTQAVPIALELKNLADNSPAGVQEVTEYNEEICTPQIVVAGPYDFALEDAHERPADVGPIQAVTSGDFNADGIVDLVWNHLTGDKNRFYIGYGTTSGYFNIVEKACASALCDLSDNAIPWGQFKLANGDFNGDGKSDLIWLRKDSSNSTVEWYIAFMGDTGFQTNLLYNSASIAITELKGDVRIADMNNDDVDDLVLWYVTHTREDNKPKTVQDYQIIRTQVTEANEVSFVLQQRRQGAKDTDYNHFDPTPLYMQIADFNSDGWNDLMWNILGQDINSFNSPDRNVTKVRLNVADSSTSEIKFWGADVFSHEDKGGWQNYRPAIGDFDGDAYVDLAWIRVINGNGAIHQAAYASGTNNFTQNPLQTWASASQVVSGDPKIFSVDVNGDAPIDIVSTQLVADTNQATLKNMLVVAKGIQGEAPFFNTIAQPQSHPIVQDWINFRHVFVGDANGDGLEDIIWNNAALDNSIFVALAKLDVHND
ncbi:thiol-activated cytolysin family protein [Aliikangiella sp. IMCC44632]